MKFPHRLKALENNRQLFLKKKKITFSKIIGRMKPMSKSAIMRREKQTKRLQKIA